MDVVQGPQYKRIEQALRERIASLRPGDRLPSDAELTTEFAVSRMTARNAMQRLAEDGLIERQPGRGSFVAVPPTHRRANRLMTFSQEMRRRGLTPSSRLLVREARPAASSEASSLDIATGDRVVFLRRLRCADGQPIALESSVLLGICESAVMAADLEGGSLHEALARGGLILRRGSGTIVAAGATAEDARLLLMRLGEPLLVERRVITDNHGRAIEATESRYPADRYALDVQFDVEAQHSSSSAGR